MVSKLLFNNLELVVIQKYRFFPMSFGRFWLFLQRGMVVLTFLYVFYSFQSFHTQLILSLLVFIIHIVKRQYPVAGQVAQNVPNIMIVEKNQQKQLSNLISPLKRLVKTFEIK